MNAKDLMNKFDTISLKDFVDNYDMLKTTLSKLQYKAKEIDWKYNFDNLPTDQISWAIQDFKELMNIIK